MRENINYILAGTPVDDIVEKLLARGSSRYKRWALKPRKYAAGGAGMGAVIGGVLAARKAKKAGKSKKEIAKHALKGAAKGALKGASVGYSVDVVTRHSKAEAGTRRHLLRKARKRKGSGDTVLQSVARREKAKARRSDVSIAHGVHTGRLIGLALRGVAKAVGG